MSERPVVIIGAGPSGLAAALQLKRQRIEPLILEKRAVGGLLNNAYLVENYPGFPGGISGRDLIEKMREHVFTWGIDIEYDSVLSVKYEGQRFVVKTESGMTYTTGFVIIASGTVPKTIHDISMRVPSTRVFHDVLSCSESIHKRFVIVGTGDAAFDYALNLSRENTVTVIGRGNTVRCLDILHERASDSQKISIYLNTKLRAVELAADDSLCIRCQRDDEKMHMVADFIIVAIGREPCLDFLDQSTLDAAPELRKRGIMYLVGDVCNGRFRQTAIAVGDGIRAAMHIAENMT